MKRHSKTFLTFTGIALFLVLYQNCSDEVNHAPSTFDGKIVALTQLDDNENVGVTLAIKDLTRQTNPLSRGLVNASNNPTPVYDDKDKVVLTRNLVNASNNPTRAFDENDQIAITQNFDSASNSSLLNSIDLNYICLLEGQDQSVRAGFYPDDSAKKRTTPKTICTNAEGCRIIARLGNVKGISERSYCKNGSAHSVKMTPDQIASLLGVSL